jgi:hypothetical protein
MENSKESEPSKRDIDALLSKYGIRDVTKENLGKTYIDITPKRKDDLVTSDGLIYLAVSGRLASNSFFEEAGLLEVWGSYNWENDELLGDAIYFGWGFAQGVRILDGEYMTTLTLDSPERKEAVEVYCVERKHIEQIEQYLLERSWSDTVPRRLVTVEPKEAIFAKPVQAWAFFSE